MLKLKLRDKEKIVITVDGKVEAVLEIVKEQGGYTALIENNQKIKFHTKAHLMKSMLGRTINEVLEL